MGDTYVKRTWREQIKLRLHSLGPAIAHAQQCMRACVSVGLLGIGRAKFGSRVNAGSVWAGHPHRSFADSLLVATAVCRSTAKSPNVNYSKERRAAIRTYAIDSILRLDYRLYGCNTPLTRPAYSPACSFCLLSPFLALSRPEMVSLCPSTILCREDASPRAVSRLCCAATSLDAISVFTSGDEPGTEQGGGGEHRVRGARTTPQAKHGEAGKSKQKQRARNRVRRQQARA